MGNGNKEKIEKRWKKQQEHLGFTDEQIAIHRANPKHVKAMESAPAFVKYKMVIEVIEAHNCGAGHKVGDKFVVDAGGCLVPDECPPGRICVSLVYAMKPVVDRMWQAFYDNSTDVFQDTVHCSDVGTHRGGWGEVTMRIRAVPKDTKINR
ncbi:MAG: hypothetical protein ABSH06_03340 [Thermodesulfobacteriota bacterium]|jgi:uncharacterized repeat protein (TIGR04076 family)